jgi:hypothetical protein
MYVSVTQEHIRQGYPGQGSYCALALAIREQLPEAKYVNVSHSGVVLIDDIRYIMDELGHNFVMAYDFTPGLVLPCTITLVED